MTTVLPAKEGQTFQLDSENVYTVQPRCEHNRGSWFCITHNKGFMNQLEKDHHIGAGSHVLVWVCSFHGVAEVP